MHLRVIIHLFLYLVVCESMTMKQMKNSGKMMRKSCQPKNNVEDDKVDSIVKGVFLDETNVKCYMACIMKMANAVKNGKINYEQAYKQADMLLPVEIKEEAKAALTTCKNAVEIASWKRECKRSRQDRAMNCENQLTGSGCNKPKIGLTKGHADICDASFHMTKCIYEANPSIFYFP